MGVKDDLSQEHDIEIKMAGGETNIAQRKDGFFIYGKFLFVLKGFVL